MTTTKNNEHKELYFSSEREQSQVCLNSAEHEKNQGRKVLNVPNLRFKEFQGEWEEHLLGNISDVTKLAGFEFTKYVTYEDTGSIIAIRGLNCKNGSLDLRDVKYIDNSDFSKLSRSKLYVGDILYTYVGTVGEVAVVDKNDKYYLAPNVSRIRLSKDYNSDFIKQLLGSKKFYNKIVFPLIATSSQPALSMENLRRFKLRVPSIKEQNKIASLFNAIDERIATQNKIIDKLQSLIKGIVDCTILRKEKNAIVGDVCSISEQIRAEANIDDIITVRLHGNGVCKSSAENLQLGATQYYRRRAGQLIYGKQNFHNGAIGIVPISLDNGITSKDIPSFDIDEMKCNSVYLLAQLQSPQYYKPAEALTTGTGSKRLKEETFLKMPIVLPNKREQDNIAVLFHRASMNLDHAKRLLELLSIQKQFLLRQMFI